MPYTTIISTADLASHLNDADWRIVDCRFKLDDAAAGRAAYRDAHISGAVYAHLDDDLSGPIIPGKTGRHPLPDIDKFAATLSGWGVDHNTQVVAYDDGNCVYAGRLWWMLRWLGHDRVAVLDGGWQHWTREGRPTRSGIDHRVAKTFVPHPRPQLQVSVNDVLANAASREAKMFDVRDETRYRGEVQGMDPVAGHIPGAQSAHYGPNLGPDGKFRSPEELRARFEALLDGSPPAETIFYCGSGVSVHHDLLALEIAGLANGPDSNARVYIGSWSDWITDPSRPVATGATP